MRAPTAAGSRTRGAAMGARRDHGSVARPAGGGVGGVRSGSILALHLVPGWAGRRMGIGKPAVYGARRMDRLLPGEASGHDPAGAPT